MLTRYGKSWKSEAVFFNVSRLDCALRVRHDSRWQRQLLDVVDSDQLTDAEATEMLQRLDTAEPGDRVQELDRGRRQTWTPTDRGLSRNNHRETHSDQRRRSLLTGDSGAQEVQELSVFGVHDGSLNELHHGVTAVLELWVAPETECP